MRHRTKGECETDSPPPLDELKPNETMAVYDGGSVVGYSTAVLRVDVKEPET